jgi:hypothetical protein
MPRQYLQGRGIILCFLYRSLLKGLVEKSTRVPEYVFVACDLITLGIAGSVNEEKLMKNAIN